MCQVEQPPRLYICHIANKLNEKFDAFQLEKMEADKKEAETEEGKKKAEAEKHDSSTQSTKSRPPGTKRVLLREIIEEEAAVSNEVPRSQMCVNKSRDLERGSIQGLSVTESRCHDPTMSGSHSSAHEFSSYVPIPDNNKSAKNSDNGFQGPPPGISPVITNPPIPTTVPESPRPAAKPRLLPEKFSGNTPVETFFAQFESCASYNNWTERDRTAHLRWCLTGHAAEILWDGQWESYTYSELVQKILRRFGNEGMEEKYRTELRCRRRRRGETLQSLYQEVRRLRALAYPGENGRLSEMMARDAFLMALDDLGLEVRVREHEPVDLDAALRLAIRLEVYHNTTEKPHPQPVGPRNNRQVQSDGPSPSDRKVGELERKFNELRRGMEAKEKADGRNRAIEQARMREEMERLVSNAKGGE